jgi:hypothetical protein
VQSVNSINVKTSLKSQLSAVIILGSGIWPGPTARGRASFRNLSHRSTKGSSQRKVRRSDVRLRAGNSGGGLVFLTNNARPKAGRHDGWRIFSELFTHVGQWGTHVDPSAHFHKGLRTVDQIELKEMDPAARVHRCSGAMGRLLLDRRERRPLGITVTRTKANI